MVKVIVKMGKQLYGGNLIKTIEHIKGRWIII